MSGIAYASERLFLSVSKASESCGFWRPPSTSGVKECSPNRLLSLPNRISPRSRKCSVLVLPVGVGLQIDIISEAGADG